MIYRPENIPPERKPKPPEIIEPAEDIRRDTIIIEQSESFRLNTQAVQDKHDRYTRMRDQGLIILDPGDKIAAIVHGDVILKYIKIETSRDIADTFDSRHMIID